MSPRATIGRLGYYLLFPLIRLAIRGSRRAYVDIRCGDRILLVQNVLGNGKWHLPGGGCHKNESYASAAIREVFEEVGLTFTQSDIATNNNVYESKAKFSYTVFTTELPQTAAVTIDRREILRAEWVSVHKLSTANASKSVLRQVSL